MNQGSANHYLTLKVARDADATTIKKAYFTLIREFPPETHPEEFQKLREAYEVLRDPEKRQEYDASTNFSDYGDDTGGHLTNAQHALDNEDWGRAIALLEPLIEERPDLHVAADMLAFAWLQSGKVPEARALLNKVLEQRPDVSKYHFHMGLVLHAAGNPHAGVDELKKAVELDPKSAEAHRWLINFALETNQTDVAVLAIDDALAHAADTIFDVFELTLRKAYLQWKEVGPKGVLEIVDGLVAKVPPDADDETRKYLAVRLSRMAATCFSQNAVNLGNTILQRCQRLRPKGMATAPFPRAVDVHVDELPAKRQAFLRTAREKSDWATSVTTHRFDVLWKAGLLAALAVAVVAYAFTPRGAWTGPELIVLPIALVGAMIGLAEALRRIWSYVSSEFDEFRFAHGVFFFHVHHDRLRAWPLFTMENIRVTEHHRQGRYAYTVLTVRFGSDVQQVRFVTRESAQQSARALDRKRNAALDLLATGLIEEDPDARFFPEPMLAAARRKQTPMERLRRAGLAWYGAGAAAGLVLAASAAMTVGARSARSVDEFITAWYAPSLSAEDRYLATHPPAEFASRIRAERARRLAAARRKCVMRALPGRKVDLCGLIPADGNATHRLLVTTHVAGGSSVNQQDGDLWSTAARSTLKQLTGDDVLDVTTGAAASPGDASLSVDCQVVPGRSGSDVRERTEGMSCNLHLTGPSGKALGQTAVSAQATGDSETTLHWALMRTLIGFVLERMGVAAEGHPAIAAITVEQATTSPYEVQ